MHSTRIYPAKGSSWETRGLDLYWDFCIYANKAQMLRAYKYYNPKKVYGKYELCFDGIVCPRRREKVSKEGKVTPLSCMGYVLMHRDALQAEPLAHEATHMAVEFLRRIKRSLRLSNWCDDREEYLAYAVGCCLHQIHEFLYKHSLGGWSP